MLTRIKKEFSRHRNAVLFVMKMLALYLSLQGIYEYLLSPYTRVDSLVINSIISLSESSLVAMGYDLIKENSIYQYHIGIEGTSGVIIGNPCDGLNLFILYAALILVFKGNIWIKALLVALGILIIHFLNVGRIIALSLIVKYYPETLDFHHSYTFTLFVYLCIFFLWVMRIKLYQTRKI